VRFGAAWASAYAFSTATLIFLASFIALSAYTASRKEAKGKPLLELIKLYENALRSQEAIAYELAAERLDRLQSQKIDLFVQQIKEIRAKTSARASQIRTKLTLDQRSEQMLTEFTSLDKAYERTLTDILAAYRSYLSGKMKREAFQKAVSEKSSSLRKLASSIREVLDEMSRM
jgi:replicative DNA helicase